MTEKRFTIWELNKAQIEDNVELESYICLNEREAEEMCELLNELHEGTQAQVIIIKEYQERCDKLFEEKQQLKYIIKEAYNTERTELGKSVLKQLMERIGIE